MDLKQKYENLRWWQGLMGPNPTQQQKDYLVYKKRELRAANKPLLGFPKVREYYDENGGDSYYVFGVAYGDKEDVYYDLFIESPHSMYDCTGRQFTAILELAPLPNQEDAWYYRHLICLDV